MTCGRSSYWNLNRVFPDAAPKAALAQLQAHFHANTARMLFLTAELLDLLRLFQTCGVPAIPLKGPVLTASVYGKLSLRAAGDLDILVHRRDVPRARDLLLSQGYVPVVPRTAAQQADYLRTGYHLALVRHDAAVELHWQILRRDVGFPLDPERLWERLESALMAGTTVCHLAPEDLLFVLCVHGAKHLWGRLKWICDVAELTRARPRLDWDCVVDRAHALGAERRLPIGLLLARDLLGPAARPRSRKGRRQMQ